MPRDGSGVYSKAEPSVVTQTTIESSVFNNVIDDLVTDANAARPISAGGTGAATASGARTNLDVAQQQSSTGDATAGRGLIVGAGGLLGVSVTQSDWDATVTVNKFIRTGSASTPNAPSTDDSWVGLNIRKTNTGYGLQLAFDPTNDYMRLRMQDAAVWGDWTDVVYLVEVENNVNGWFWKYSDGKMVCTNQGSILTADQTSGSIFFSDTETWTYPAAFAFEPYNITITGERLSGGRVWCGLSETSGTTETTARLLASTTGSLGKIQYRAEGRWR